MVLARDDRSARCRRAATAEESVRVEDCQRVSRDLSALLDVEDATRRADRAYTLEVSSPGLDRPLRPPGTIAGSPGRRAKIVMREPVDGQRFFGRLGGVEGDVVLLDAGRKTHRCRSG